MAAFVSGITFRDSAMNGVKITVAFSVLDYAAIALNGNICTTTLNCYMTFKADAVYDMSNNIANALNTGLKAYVSASDDSSPSLLTPTNSFVSFDWTM